MKYAATLALAAILALAGATLARAEDPPPDPCVPVPFHPCHTAVALVSFTASNGVLRWSTAQEVGLAGFNVYAGARKVNAHLIRAAGDLGGHRYVYRTRVHSLRWRLQAVNVDGSMSWFDGR